MKKMLFGLAFMGSILFTTYEVNAQASVDPGNGSGGACCMKLDESCQHPSAGNFADSIWNSSAGTGC